ncbi:MAG: hypothetical protein JSV38_02865 [Desulfobacterales bacterium]|nr:MAG: hypothetical protein JSV38_02865 [Desulfobacterales bacterium]
MWRKQANYLFFYKYVHNDLKNNILDRSGAVIILALPFLGQALRPDSQISKLRREASCSFCASFLGETKRKIATGNFSVIFKDVEIPPLPAAVNRLIVEINKTEPDINKLVMLISSATAIAAKVIKTVIGA